MFHIKKSIKQLFIFQELSGVAARLIRILMLPQMSFDFRRLDKLVIVTGASLTHQKSLINLIRSIELYVTDPVIYVHDFGMSPKYLDLLRVISKSNKIYILQYDFSSKPAWMHIRNKNKGEWAWKSDCINKSLKLHESKNKVKDSMVYLWLDAGNVVVHSLDTITRYCQNYGFWSPASDGNIAKWTVQQSINRVIGSNSFNNKVCLSGSMIGFSTRKPDAINLINDWFEFSMQKDVIAPEGSSRANHRQDQSLLSLLAYKYNLAPKRSGLKLQDNLILCHQDID